MAKDNSEAVGRIPPDDLRACVQQFFKRVSRLEMPDGTNFRTNATRRPSHVEALNALGFTESAYSGWKNGTRSRDGTFNRHLLDGMKGDLQWVPATGKLRADLAWAAAREEQSVSELFTELIAGLAAHDRTLAMADTDRRSGAMRENRTSPRPAAQGGDTSPSDARWSAPWTQKAVEPWARALADGKDRVAYIYGARGSGKNVLTTALAADLMSRRERAARIHLNVRDLAAHFRTHRDREAVLAEILHEVGGRTGRAQVSPNFDDEMARALDHITDGPIYLFIENADACLRIEEPELREATTAATAPLFNFLRPVAQETGKPVLDRVSVILDGARPLGDVAREYPASPLNDASQHVLKRLDEVECSELGRLAGLDLDEDLARLFDLTAGHRSLVWAILKSVGSEAGRGMPAHPADLDLVVKAVGKLREELTSQPPLAEAFGKVRCGVRIDFDSRTRLRHTMYIDDADPPTCGCPLLETLLEVDR